MSTFDGREDERLALEEFDQNTKDLLRSARADVRESFYHTTSPKTVLVVLAVVFFLSIGILSIFTEGILRYCIAMTSIFGLAALALRGSSRLR